MLPRFEQFEYRVEKLTSATSGYLQSSVAVWRSHAMSEG